MKSEKNQHQSNTNKEEEEEAHDDGRTDRNSTHNTRVESNEDYSQAGSYPQCFQQPSNNNPFLRRQDLTGHYHHTHTQPANRVVNNAYRGHIETIAHDSTRTMPMTLHSLDARRDFIVSIIDQALAIVEDANMSHDGRSINAAHLPEPH